MVEAGKFTQPTRTLDFDKIKSNQYRKYLLLLSPKLNSIVL